MLGCPSPFDELPANQTLGHRLYLGQSFNANAYVQVAEVTDWSCYSKSRESVSLLCGYD